MTALVDADIICYRSAAASEGEPLDVAITRTDLMMRNILDKEDSYIAFLSGERNFRKEINPEYKANRKDVVKPKWLNDCKQYLVDEYNAIVTDGYEADDALGFNQTENTTIYSIDKDLLMIPGCHFNFVRNEFYEIDEFTGLKNFYKQMLIGDSSDNIFGVSKIGKVKASKLIDCLETEDEMFNLVVDLYSDPERFIMNANCLWIWRQEGETYSKRVDRRTTT